MVRGFQSFGSVVRVSLTSLLLPLALTAGLAAPARSDGATGRPRTHDKYFARFTVGGGSASTSFEDATGSVELDGGAFEFTVALGHAVAPDLILFLGALGPLMIDPHIEVVDTVRSSGTFRGTAGAMGVGLGLTYYLMPANVFVSGTVGWGGLRFVPNEGDESYESSRGTLAALELGKEWWLGDAAGLGIVGGATWHWMPEGAQRWSGVGYTVRLCLTAN